MRRTRPSVTAAAILAISCVSGALGQSLADVAQKETKPLSPGLSLIYTGRSLGALGALRSQDEHELLTERANEQ